MTSLTIGKKMGETDRWTDTRPLHYAFRYGRGQLRLITRLSGLLERQQSDIAVTWLHASLWQYSNNDLFAVINLYVNFIVRSALILHSYVGWWLWTSPSATKSIAFTCSFLLPSRRVLGLDTDVILHHTVWVKTYYHLRFSVKISLTTENF